MQQLQKTQMRPRQATRFRPPPVRCSILELDGAETPLALVDNFGVRIHFPFFAQQLIHWRSPQETSASRMKPLEGLRVNLSQAASQELKDDLGLMTLQQPIETRRQNFARQSPRLSQPFSLQNPDPLPRMTRGSKSQPKQVAREATRKNPLTRRCPDFSKHDPGEHQDDLGLGTRH